MSFFDYSVDGCIRCRDGRCGKMRSRKGCLPHKRYSRQSRVVVLSVQATPTVHVSVQRWEVRCVLYVGWRMVRREKRVREEGEQYSGREGGRREERKDGE